MSAASSYPVAQITTTDEATDINADVAFPWDAEDIVNGAFYTLDATAHRLTFEAAGLYRVRATIGSSFSIGSGGDHQLFMAAGDTTTNINQATWGNMSNWGTAAISDAPYTFDGTTLTFDEAGTYLVYAQCDFNSTVARVAPQIGFYLNGATWLQLARHGYMRNADGHNSGSLTVATLLEAAAADSMVIRCGRDAATETVAPHRSEWVAVRLAGGSSGGGGVGPTWGFEANGATVLPGVAHTLPGQLEVLFEAADGDYLETRMTASGSGTVTADAASSVLVAERVGT